MSISSSALRKALTLSKTQSFFRLIAISAALDSDSRYAFCIVNTESASDAIVIVELNRGLEALDCAEDNAASICVATRSDGRNYWHGRGHVYLWGMGRPVDARTGDTIRSGDLYRPICRESRQSGSANRSDGQNLICGDRYLIRQTPPDNIEIQRPLYLWSLLELTCKRPMRVS